MALLPRASQGRPAGGAELWSWLFMRLSGLALIFLALGHLVLMHLIHNVDTIDYAFVAGRYGVRFSWWRVYDLALLLLALLHGLNGIHILIDDYVHPPRWHRAAVAFLYIVGATFLVLGAGAIIIFRPVSA